MKKYKSKFIETKEMYELEDIVDSQGLSNVIDLLSEICYEKADHLRSNWQDESLARSWEKDASILDKISGRLNN